MHISQYRTLWFNKITWTANAYMWWTVLDRILSSSRPMAGERLPRTSRPHNLRDCPCWLDPNLFTKTVALLQALAILNPSHLSWIQLPTRTFCCIQPFPMIQIVRTDVSCHNLSQKQEASSKIYRWVIPFHLHLSLGFFKIASTRPQLRLITPWMDGSREIGCCFRIRRIQLSNLTM
jgi:hypothetical protein